MNLATLRVVLVEDESANVRLLRRLLYRIGVREDHVVELNDGACAVPSGRAPGGRVPGVCVPVGVRLLGLAARIWACVPINLGGVWWCVVV